MANVASLLPTERATRWTTPRILKAARTALIALDVVLMLVAISAVHVERDALKAVGHDTVPSIVAAQHIKASLADMDAEAANELLAPAGSSSARTQPYDARRTEAALELVHAAQNITYEKELAPVQTLTAGLGDYERAIQHARDLHDEGKGPEAVAAYAQAAGVMDGTLLPAADRLDAANNDEFEKVYDRQKANGAEVRSLLAFAGLVLLAGLGVLQYFLSARTRRTLNPLLLFASLVTLLVAGHALFAVSGAQGQLRSAREDAFASLHALWQARSLSFQANGEESRFLLNPAHAADSLAAFGRESASLAAFGKGVNPDDVVLREQRGDKRVPGFTGYLADELNNITYSDELGPATETLRTWVRYVAIDAQLRALEARGQHAAAVALDTGTAAGDSDWAFSEFDKNLAATLDINQKAFDSSIAAGEQSLNNLDWEAAVAAAAIGVLLFLGLRPRLREYE